MYVFLFNFLCPFAVIQPFFTLTRFLSERLAMALPIAVWDELKTLTNSLRFFHSILPLWKWIKYKYTRFAKTYR